MTNEIEKVKAYAKRLEEIIQAVEVDTPTRMIMNSLVGSAKEKYDMYDENPIRHERDN
jgi:hypothetical protein